MLLAVSIPTVLAVPKSRIGIAFALSWSAAEIFGSILALLLLRRKIGSIDGKRIFVSLLRAAGAALPALIFGALLWLVTRAIVPDPSVIQALIFGVVTAALVASMYLGGLTLLRSPELAQLLSRVRRKG